MKHKKILSIILSLCMLFSITVGVDISAYAVMNISQAVSWANSQVGKRVGGGQCTDLITQYWRQLGYSTYCNSGYKYPSGQGSMPPGSKMIVYKSGVNAQVGDIAVYSKGWQGGSYGHVAIVAGVSGSNLTLIEQYGSTDNLTHRNVKGYNRGEGYILYGFIRHAGSSLDSGTNSGAKGSMTTPTISMSRTSFSPGEKVKFTWSKTSSDTDFYQYWLVVENKTTNKRPFEGATGKAGDVSANTYELTLNELGNYLVTVYAVPYNDKNNRQKAATKSFYVGNSSMTMPTIHLSKTDFEIGEKVYITWDKTSSNSDFYQYWLVVDNKTTGKRIFGGSPGGAGDVNANYYQFIAESAGQYQVDVYAVPYNDKDSRSKVCSDSFTITHKEIVTPYISLNKRGYHIGDIMYISWQKSNANIGFKQYWLVIDNLTTGIRLFGASPGGAGDVNANHYEMALTSAGTYKIDVYSVPYDNKGANQKADSITVQVTNKHEYDIALKTEATCTEDGIIIKECICGDKTEIITKATNHSFYDKNEYCLNGCGKKNPNYKHIHSWNDGIIIGDVTCIENGKMKFTCLECGDEDIEFIYANGHNYVNTITKATTTKNGSKVTKCFVCGTQSAKATIYYPKTITLSTTKYTYDGKVKKPSVKVVDSNGKTIASSNYTVTYPSGCKNVGKYTVKITFKGNYSGTLSKTFVINPKNTSISKLTATKGGFKATIKKYTTQTTGYQIRYSTKSNMSGAKTVTIAKNTTTSKSVTGLSKGKKYYVQIRTFRTVNGTKYYSAWSGNKTVTTKK